MKKLKQYHFWYGAILNTIFECNPDASPTLIETTDKRGIFKIITNTSKKECIIFCKYAFKKDNTSKTYESWSFAFSEEDKKRMQEYYDKNYPVFIYLLCAVDGLKESEIAICTYDEYSVVKNKQIITIGREKNKTYFNLHTERRRETGIHLKRNRIEKKYDEIIDELVNFSPEHYKNVISQNIKIDVGNIEKSANSKLYDRAVSGQVLRYLSLSYREDDICPIHMEKMKPIYVHIGKMKDTAYFCQKCGKYMIPTERYSQLIKNLGKTAKDIEFEAIVQSCK